MSNPQVSPHSVRVTREELYRQVWQSPMSHLAAEYGISGSGLAKICTRLNVPYPPRGWWAKKAAGKDVAISRLPPADEATPSSVVISPTPRPEPPVALPAKAQQQLDEARENASSLTVPQHPTKPHPVIARWLDDHERRKVEARRERDPWMRSMVRPSEFTPQDRRRHRILDTLFKELGRNGGKVKEDERRRLTVELSGEVIEFRLREKQKQVRRPLTDDEKRWWSSTGRDWKQELEGVVSRIWWKFSSDVLRASGFGPDQAARSRLIGAMG
ncbi:hypothetical protein [Hyphomonas sp.]|uniref:hypothetical protein n=1 Tax=Hyphomonas sp. TaxID=87 RepID=UPI003567E809